MTAGAHFHPPGVMHDHPHGSTHAVGESYAHVQGGPTVLDIGGDIGALVATMNPQAVAQRSRQRPLRPEGRTRSVRGANADHQAPRTEGLT